MKPVVYKIEKGLYQGGMPEEPLEGIDAVISLMVTPPSLVIAEKAQIWLPIEDGIFPGLDWLKLAVQIIDVLQQNNWSTYVHCRCGISRSVMLTAAYLMKKHNWTFDKTLNHIAKINPCIDPAPKFISGLKEWQKVC